MRVVDGQKTISNKDYQFGEHTNVLRASGSRQVCSSGDVFRAGSMYVPTSGLNPALFVHG